MWFILHLYTSSSKPDKGVIIVTLVHLILKHLDKPNTKSSALFIGFTSALNTIQNELLLAKKIQMEVNPHLTQ